MYQLSEILLKQKLFIKSAKKNSILTEKIEEGHKEK